MADYDPLNFDTWPPEERKQLLDAIATTKIDYEKWIGDCPDCGAPPGKYCTRPSTVGRRIGARVIMTEPHPNRPT